ncbi:hypothetical protein BO71DRAFT_451532 [Aspergillus ellipticus CBS 707.79]|uniref:Rhodopsin domain-containing protein n=1 Tax=Aspergillus ellipticus CBS 707.79 TaxID=1448320 RepID=A0A319D484_9EURO|nr:hypothetical protein BO71DRAFT_451532 [Aspergillus ellipticus CBS 707.79]
MAMVDTTVHQDKGPLLLAVMWPLTGFATLMVATRLYIRAKIIRNLGLDDWLITLSILIGLINVIILTVGVHHGFGKHSSTIGTAATEQANFIIDVGWVFAILSFAIPKLGVAALLQRILNLSSLMRGALWGLTGLVAAVAVVNIVLFFTSCNPPQALWTTVPDATCRSSSAIIHFATFNGALSAFTDLALAIYPSLVLWRLQMSLRKKIALCTVLGVGAISACAAIIKITHLKALGDTTDATYGSWSLVLWTNVEADLVVLGSCIPTLQPPLEFMLGTRTRSSSDQTPSYPYKNSIIRWKRVQASPRTDDTLWDDSQEMIVPENTPKASTAIQIYRTDQVVGEYEMQNQPPRQHQDDGVC